MTIGYSVAPACPLSGHALSVMLLPRSEGTQASQGAVHLVKSRGLPPAAKRVWPLGGGGSSSPRQTCR